MGIRAKRLGQTLLVYLEGELDLHTAEPFREAVTHAFQSDTRLRHLILLMNEVTFVDSSGVGAILGRYREVGQREGRVAVVGLQVPVKKIFALSGMLKIIAVYDSEGQALASL